MTYIFLVLGSILLFSGFLGLTIVEARTGRRVLAAPRHTLDVKVSQAMFIIEHVNWSDFLSHFVQSIAARVVHDIAHWSLLFVRFVERRLTAIVRYMRDRRPNLLAPRPSRRSPLDQTVSYLKKRLHLSRHLPPRKE